MTSSNVTPHLSTTQDEKVSVQEPLLTKPDNPLDFFTTRYPTVLHYAKLQVAAMWEETEISFQNDRADFQKLPKEVQRLIEHALGFFFGADAIVFKNIEENFMSEIELPEAKGMYSVFQAMEWIHARSYGLQLDTITGGDLEWKRRIMEAISSNPCVKKKGDWALNYMNKKYSFAERLLAYACVEHIFFSSPFAWIYWIKETYPGKMEGVTESNEAIARDEGIHVQGNLCLYHDVLVDKLSTDKALAIIKEAAEIEIEFALDALTENLLGLSRKGMTDHIYHVANLTAVRAGYPAPYPVVKESPLKCVKMIDFVSKTNFFEKKNMEYRRPVGTGRINFDKPVDF
jgi:ribonucleotide reductase beta subunit family protein with ferritin-like domain